MPFISFEKSWSCSRFRSRFSSNFNLIILFVLYAFHTEIDLVWKFTDKTDIVDEAISFFRANVFFRNFDIKSPADKLLIYLTFHINVALKRLEGCRTLTVGNKAIINLGLENVPVPGEQGFPFPGLFPIPKSNGEAGNA